jgi:gliding motility-associated-like protein
VVDFVTLSAMPDTTICFTDSVKLHISSDGLQYQWSAVPASGIDDPNAKTPTVLPNGSPTTFQVQANIGSCVAVENIIVNTDPYPIANAGPDTTICYNSPAILQGTHDGSSFNWTPSGTLANANTLSPVAFPLDTTMYVLTVYDTLNMPGCPKPGFDTVIVNVTPKINPFAGKDTIVVVGQPLQFNADGGVNYLWSPTTYLDNPNIKNPIAVYGVEADSIRYMVKVFNEIGCADSAYIKVTVFKTNPYVFVPTAFTPNGDGLNDVIRPIAVGVQEIKYFRVFNRWGQMVFHTTTNEQGWDGRIKGTLQGTNVFVWMVSATDYLGNPIFLKGTVTLIR